MPLPLCSETVGGRAGGWGPHSDTSGIKVQGLPLGPGRGRREQGPADKVSSELKAREEGLAVRPGRHRGPEQGAGGGRGGKQLPPRLSITNLTSISAGEGSSYLTPLLRSAWWDQLRGGGG